MNDADNTYYSRSYYVSSIENELRRGIPDQRLIDFWKEMIRDIDGRHRQHYNELSTKRHEDLTESQRNFLQSYDEGDLQLQLTA